jgi:hypothetical protein
MPDGSWLQAQSGQQQHDRSAWKRLGRGNWTVTGRGWTHAALGPGIRYAAPPAPPEAEPLEFQQANGLQVDGVVGGATWRAAWTAPAPALAYPGRRG